MQTKGSTITTMGDLDWTLQHSTHIWVREHCYLTTHVEAYAFWRLREHLRKGELFVAVNQKEAA